MASSVHVVFKTHLDVGFTDLAKRVVQRYHEVHIPRAVALARQLRESVGNTGPYKILGQFRSGSFGAILSCMLRGVVLTISLSNLKSLSFLRWITP